jgi:hypothetical protein
VKRSRNKPRAATAANNGDPEFVVYVGRPNFEKPREKEFPFRRTVFIFGIPAKNSMDFLREMLKPFGTVNKIQFDHSPDGIDRKIGVRFLNKPRVYTLFYYPADVNVDLNNIDESNIDRIRRTQQEMIFRTVYEFNQNETKTSAAANEKQLSTSTIKCHQCNKDKSVVEGYYTTKEWNVIFCAQCAAQLAEEQLNTYYKQRNLTQYSQLMKQAWLGTPPSDEPERVTALVVFASQRQASKCAYVRTRIAYNGAFATHFHHYSKVKKEIVLNQTGQQMNEDDACSDTLIQLDMSDNIAMNSKSNGRFSKSPMSTPPATRKQKGKKTRTPQPLRTKSPVVPDS